MLELLTVVLSIKALLEKGEHEKAIEVLSIIEDEIRTKPRKQTDTDEG